MKNKDGRLSFYFVIGLSFMLLWACDHKNPETVQKQELSSLSESDQKVREDEDLEKEAKDQKEKIEKTKKEKKSEEKIKDSQEKVKQGSTEKKASVEKKQSTEKQAAPTQSKDKIEYKVIREKKVLAFKTKRVETDSLSKGSEQVSQEGKEGYQIIEHKDKYVNGKKVSRSSTMLDELSPIDHIIAVGTSVEGAWDHALAYSVFEDWNRYRLENGLEVLVWDDQIAKMAKIRAKEIVTLYDHFRPDGTYYDSVFDEVGYNVCGSGENISNIYTTVEDVMLAWSLSGSHNNNMLDAYSNSAAVGVYRDFDGTVYWVQIIAEKC